MAQSPTNALDSVREFFLLRKAEALTAKVPAEVRSETARAVEIARQKREAAEILWLGGSTAEALKLARDAFEQVATASERAGGPSAAPSEPSQQVVDLRAKLAATPLPDVDADVKAPSTPLFFDLLSAHDALSSGIAVVGMTPKDVRDRRRRRAVYTVLALAVTILVGWRLLRTPLVVRAEASTSYSDKYAPAKALDGRPEAEWILPDGVLGWIDFHFGAPSKIKAMKILNIHNGIYNDRATKDYHIEVFGKGGQLLQSIDGTYPAFSDSPAWVTIPLSASGVERIRFEVKSFHQYGGGLAEVEFEQ